MDGHCGPCAELALGERECVPDGWEDEESYGVECEDGCERDACGVLFGIDGGCHGGDGAAATDCGAGGDEERGFFFDTEKFGEEEAGEEDG